MGLMNKVKKLASKENVDKAKGLAAKNADKITGTVEKATSTIDQKTGGKYRDKLDKVEDSVARNLDKVKDEGDDPGTGTADGTPPGGPAGPTR
ncbi:antitoxin [Acidimicrobiia bacterium EGI L10123]|uniref:antitoxin n=1 Tax=Salinilacustrithrix flava TaxID=2957203 RepID=UPI003D7C189C|nr:antitoxin [Acidimicrobiia bacterium EGI L10123]